MFRRDPTAAALERVGEVLAADLRPLRSLTRAVFARGGVLAVAHGSSRLMVPLGGVPVGGVFELASVSKPFTAALVAALVQAGQLTWEAPLRGLGGPFRALPRPLTPLALATHTAGLPMHPARAAVTAFTRFHDPYGGMDTRAALSSAARWANPRRAGRFLYSNLGVGVLAMAAAYVAGETPDAAGYGRALRHWVTGPHGLDSVTLVPPAGLVTPAGWLGGGDVTGFGPLAGAGGLLGTAADLLTFAQAHLSGQVGRAWTQTCRPAGLPAALGGVAPGWMVTGLPSRGAWWHDGVARGTRSGLGFRPESGAVVALLARGGAPLGRQAGVPLLLNGLLRA